MQKTKKFKGLYCLRPFTHFDIYHFGTTSSCCGGWLPNFNAGNIEEHTLAEVWNSENMQKQRLSILDGTYRFCSKEICPFLNSKEFKLYTREELEMTVTAAEQGLELADPELNYVKTLAPWMRRILDGKVELDILPANYNLAYDDSCNLRCPSCRTQSSVHTQGEVYERRLKIHHNIFNDIEKNGFDKVRYFTVTGAGDPFCSRIFSDWLFNFDGSKYPQLKIVIMTNGVLLTPETWEKMSKIHSNIENVFISIDAATAETYRQIRVNGNFERLLRNIEFLGEMRRANKLQYLILALIVQKKNYREMVDLIDLAKKYHVDRVSFSALYNWDTWEMDEFRANSVCDPEHPEYPQLLEILKNPVFDEHIVMLGNLTTLRNQAIGLDKTS